MQTVKFYFLLAISVLCISIKAQQPSPPEHSNTQYIQERNARYAALFQQHQAEMKAAKDTATAKTSKPAMPSANNSPKPAISLPKYTPGEKKEPKRVQMTPLNLPNVKGKGIEPKAGE